MKIEKIRNELKRLRDYLKENNIAYGFIYGEDENVKNVCLSIRVTSLPCPPALHKLAENLARKYGIKCYADCDNWTEDKREDELKYSLRYGVSCFKEEEIEKNAIKLVDAKNELYKILETKVEAIDLSLEWFIKYL